MRRLVLAAVLIAAAVQTPLLHAQEVSESEPPPLEPIAQMEAESTASASTTAPPSDPADARQLEPITADSETLHAGTHVTTGELQTTAGAAQETTTPDTPVDDGEEVPVDSEPTEPGAGEDPTTTTPENVQEPDEEEFGTRFDDEPPAEPRPEPRPAASAPAAAAAPVARLPETGADLAPLALLALALAMAGSGLRGMTARV